MTMLVMLLAVALTGTAPGLLPGAARLLDSVAFDAVPAATSVELEAVLEVLAALCD